MRNRHRRTLEAIYSRPTQAGIRWAEIESLLLACGAAIEERAGSRIRVALNGFRITVHRPHPQPDAPKHTVNTVRKFLMDLEIEP